MRPGGLGFFWLGGVLVHCASVVLRPAKQLLTSNPITLSDVLAFGLSAQRLEIVAAVPQNPRVDE